MIKLPDITLVAFGSTNKEGMKRALEASQKGIEWGDVKLIEHKCNGIDEWNKNVVFHLGDYIETPFALLIHPDGYVVEPEMWRDEWLGYDYIGAPWPLPTDDYSYKDITGAIIRVGNSVSLRSKRLLRLPKRLGMEWKAFHGFTNEDGYICVNMRHLFEQNGCKFAPIEVAAEFSREHDVPENRKVEKTFCFHKHFSRRNLIYPLFE